MMLDFELETLKDQLGCTKVPRLIQILSGGDINDVFLLDSAFGKLVVKRNLFEAFPEMLAKEMRALKYFNANVALNYAKPILSYSEGKYQYLVLAYAEKGRNTPEAQERLGHDLAMQHRTTNESFGWEENNYIGSLKQVNEWQREWSVFYAENRILPLTILAYENNKLPTTVLKRIECLCQHFPEIFPNEPPALLHGDLWGGNYFIQTNRAPFLYDPAVYFGHREMDIAMTQLFGSFSDDFLSAYQATYPLENDWRNRIPLCQLYPLLVHLNLFGSTYLNSVKRVLEFEGL